MFTNTLVFHIPDQAFILLLLLCVYYVWGHVCTSVLRVRVPVVSRDVYITTVPSEFQKAHGSFTSVSRCLKKGRDGREEEQRWVGEEEEKETDKELPTGVGTA